MAQVIGLVCDKCERGYNIYIPAEKICRFFRCSPEDIEFARNVDLEVSRNGTIEKIKLIAKTTSRSFVDGRTTNVVRCECGEIYDFTLFFYLPYRDFVMKRLGLK